ncbi:MAG TPA: gamma-glutamyltransferase [Nitrososphaerales archaeon]|nr:gamma-glutamyltransferase [Nitrososphaerales archaeon]
MTQLSKSGIVVSAHSIASLAGAKILRAGGNAVDAAIATSLMLGVVEPAFSGIGGGGLALIHTASGKTVALDYRETAPLAVKPDVFVGDGKGKNSRGPLSVATPGLLSGHMRMLEEYGTMSYKGVARPAVEAAGSGLACERASETVLAENRNGTLEKIRAYEETMRTFTSGGNGRRGSMPALADTMKMLSEDGGTGFYSGSIPREISTFVTRLGGLLSEDDFGKYESKWREPVEETVWGMRVVSMPPPSAGGTLLLLGLRLLDELGLRQGASEAQYLGLVSEVLRTVLAERGRFGDPDFVLSPTVEQLLKRDLRSLSEEIGSKSVHGRRERSVDSPGSTTHFCVADRMGNLVAATETIECYYGSGITVPRLGVLLNDEMHDFDVATGRPNSVAPGKRPVSSTCPTIVFKDGSPLLALGGAGSERIISSALQVILNVTVAQMGLREALAAPRIHPVGEETLAEGGLSTEAMGPLRGLRQRVGLDMYFGGVQALKFEDEGVEGAADPRRLGSAVRA